MWWTSAPWRDGLVLAPHQVLGLRAPARGEHRRVLQQDQRVGDLAVQPPLAPGRASRRWPAPYGTGPAGSISQRGTRRPADQTPRSSAKSQRLEVLLDAGQELGREFAVDHPVIPRHREVDHRADRDRVVDHDRPLLDRVERQDPGVRLVDDRHASSEPNGPGFVIVNVAPVHLVGLELLRPRARGEVGDRAREPGDVHRVGVLHHRHDQALVVADRDPHVHVVANDESSSPRSSALTIGNVRSASDTARVTNGR